MSSKLNVCSCYTYERCQAWDGVQFSATTPQISLLPTHSSPAIRCQNQGSSIESNYLYISERGISIECGLALSLSQFFVWSRFKSGTSYPLGCLRNRTFSIQIYSSVLITFCAGCLCNRLGKLSIILSLCLMMANEPKHVAF